MVKVKFKLTHNPIAKIMRHWLSAHPTKPFTLDTMCGICGLDGEKALHRARVYNVIRYWRNTGITYWQILEEDGVVGNGHIIKDWEVFRKSYNNHGGYLFYYDKGTKAYYQPSITEKEIIDQRRVERHVYAIETVLKEMGIYHERILKTGMDVKQALKEATDYRHRCITDGSYRK